MNIANLFFLFAASPDAARAAARDDPQLGRGRGLRRMKVLRLYPLTSGCRCRPERDRGVELTRMEGPGFGSFLIAGKASEPPGAIEEPWGREAAPRLADGDGRDEGAIGCRILRHEMLHRLGHLMNGVRGHQPQSLSKLLIGDRNPLLGDLLKVLQKPWNDRLTRLPIDVRRRGEVLCYECHDAFLTRSNGLTRALYAGDDFFVGAGVRPACRRARPPRSRSGSDS